MMDGQVLELLHRKIQERINDLTESMVGGAAQDFAEHRHQVGAIRGLATAQMEINDLLHRLKEKDNDD